MIRFILSPSSKLRTNIAYRTIINSGANSIFNFSTKKYILSQFPYPSGQLHLGHARVYYIGDTLSRFYKLQNNQVIYPIGFDSFGLPAENAAILHGKNPKVWTQNNIQQMKEQLNFLNINFDWDRQFATHTPQYYRWTQQIFIQMFKKGLAYKAQSQVNWDPVDKTVLANEQVDNLGRSWRSGALVEKRMLSQWFLKITHYAQQLQHNLKNLEWIERVKSMQAGWIGFQRGYETQMIIQNLQGDVETILAGQQQILKKLKSQKINVFIRNPKQLQNNFNYVRINRENKNKDSQSKLQQKIIILGYVKNPIKGGQRVPLILGDQQNGTKFELIQRKAINMESQKLIVKENQKEKEKRSISEEQLSLNKVEVMRIKDWSISRQRYWGTPIPIVYCDKCGSVPQQNLPVILPQWKGEKNPLLSQLFKNCACPKCRGPAKRQTDTMDTFVDSSWYFLRFLDNKNDKQICSKKLADYWMPVDIYIGGIQHAIMHLLYARFVMRCLSDMGISEIKQPFKELIVQGLVKGKAIRHKITGKYLRPDEIKSYNANELEETYEKMSKSKFNGLNPQFLVEKYGPDSLRMALFFASPPQHDIDFHEDLLVSAERFLKKIEELHKQLNIVQTQVKTSVNIQNRLKQFSSQHSSQAFNLKSILIKLQSAIQKRHMHVYIANTMELFNQVKQICKQNQNQKNICELVFKNIFLPVVSVVAPLTVKKLCNIDENNLSEFQWPKSQFFANKKQFIIMKGNKLLHKGILQYEGEDISESEIKQKLKLGKEAIVKNNKKNIIIITK